jgi:hypothetical protein
MEKIVFFDRSNGGQHNINKDFFVEQIRYGHQVHVKTVPV